MANNEEERWYDERHEAMVVEEDNDLVELMDQIWDQAVADHPDYTREDVAKNAFQRLEMRRLWTEEFELMTARNVFNRAKHEPSAHAEQMHRERLKRLSIVRARIQELRKELDNPGSL